MSRFMPDMYYKSILDIDYPKLKKNGIKVLLFDFDDTIIPHKVYDLDEEYIKTLKNIKKDFKVYIISNSFNKNKLSTLCTKIGVPYVGKSLKPLGHGYRKLKLKEEAKSIAMIGDQLITDIWGSKRRGYVGILVDPINPATEVLPTKINRKIEDIIIKKLKKFKRGEYYG